MRKHLPSPNLHKPTGSNPHPLSREEQNHLKNLVLGDNNYASGVNLITVPARQASFRHEMGYIFDDVGSDSDSVFKTSTIFAPEGTDDEKASKVSWQVLPYEPILLRIR